MHAGGHRFEPDILHIKIANELFRREKVWNKKFHRDLKTLKRFKFSFNPTKIPYKGLRVNDL